MKVFVLGLDGATMDLLEPLMKMGSLPNLSRLCEEGSWGEMQSIFPPVTGPAWLAIASGLNPGKTGIFDYINRREADSTEMFPISSAYYEGRAVWDVLGSQGYKVGVFNYPTLSPAPQVSGFSVSGVGAYAKERLCWPEGLEDELRKVAGPFDSRLNLKSRRYEKDIQLFFDDLDKVVESQATALKYLIKEKDWDFFFGVFHFTDWMQHILWKYLDDEYPFHDADNAELVMREFARIWGWIDRVIGQILELIGQSVFMIVSDHGAGSLDSAFYPNTYLQERGWLKKNAGTARRIETAEAVTRLIAAIDNKYVAKPLRRLRRALRGGRDFTDVIDFENSLAYCPIHAGIYGCINLTPRGKEKGGFREELIESIRSLPKETAGIDEVEIILPEDVYKGPYVDLAPDILFVINGYRTSVETDFAKEAFSNTPSIAARTGSHRMNGIFMAHGEVIRKGRLEGVEIMDITPTILALCDTEIPGDMDGRVITECISEAYLEKITIRKGEATQGEQKKVENDREIEEMKKTLETLGYL